MYGPSVAGAETIRGVDFLSVDPSAQENSLAGRRNPIRLRSFSGVQLVRGLILRTFSLRLCKVDCSRRVIPALPQGSHCSRSTARSKLADTHPVPATQAKHSKPVPGACLPTEDKPDTRGRFSGREFWCLHQLRLMRLSPAPESMRDCRGAVDKYLPYRAAEGTLRKSSKRPLPRGHEFGTIALRGLVRCRTSAGTDRTLRSSRVPPLRQSWLENRAPPSSVAPSQRYPPPL